jgi:hypothetical protein
LIQLLEEIFLQSLTLVGFRALLVVVTCLTDKLSHSHSDTRVETSIKALLGPAQIFPDAFEHQEII